MYYAKFLRRMLTMEKMLNSENFEKEVLSTDSPVIVDFYASWCGPCKMLAPVLEKIESRYSGSLKVEKIDIDKYPDIASKYEIMSVPTLMFFSGGELIRRETGFLPEEKLKEIIEKDFCILKNNQ